jgi:hypothetical protein
MGERAQHDSGPTKVEPPLISSKGLYLPSWAIGLVASAVIALTALGAEARIRLGAQEVALAMVRAELREAVASLRAETKQDRDRSQLDRDAVARELTALKVTLAAICAATKARCP